MKKMNSKGFTLIELLAVITIMGILMMVAIPSVSRTIENSRRDTFANVAHEYVNAVRNNFIADNIECQKTSTATDYTVASALPTGEYYFVIATATNTNTPFSATYVTSTTDLMESGGLSPFGNTDMYGYVHVSKTVDTTTGKSKMTYKAAIVDAAGHGFDTETAENSIKRSNINVTGMDIGKVSGRAASGSGASAVAAGTLNGKKLCKLS